jgi:Flp pilus assembly pilin Flp
MGRDLRKGQSILEYTLLLGAVIAVIVTVLLAQGTGIKDKIKAVYEKAGDALTNTTADLTKGIFK